MTIAPESRPLLPVATTPHYARGKRVAATCYWKCADQCAHPAPNVSANEYFRDVASRALSRRVMLGGMAVAAGAVVVGAEALGAEPAQAATLTGRGHGHGHGKGLSFGPIETQDRLVDDVVVPRGYEWSTIIRWGDPILPGGHAFDVTAQSEAQQKLQFGYNVDYLDILPEHPRDIRSMVETRRGRRGLLVTNHEYTNPDIMFDESYDEATKRAVQRAAHGMSVVEVVRRRTGDPWTYLRVAPKNRRVHMDTEFTIDGPVAGHDLMKTVEDPTGTTVRGTLNNCAGGTTPWGTVLSGEENWHGYFKVAGGDPRDARYGLSSSPTRYGWELDDPRFDTSNPGYENEHHRFGWVVEIDPYDPTAAPVKHTALGRFKHEGANVIVAPDKRVVAYMGDDEQFDYVYKFVSKNAMRNGHSHWARAHNKTLLSEGDLYVAKFTGDSPAAEIDGTGALPSDGAFDGTGEWLPLVVDGASAVPGMSVEEVLLFTRVAADTVGATKMDRPEDVEPNPFTGNVYVACTNNSSRGSSGREGATEPNPRNQNRDGHVVEIVEGDQTSTDFRWNLLLVAGDPSQNDSTYFSGFPADKVSPISCPDNVAFDQQGNLWISTDGQPSAIGRCDGIFRVTLTGRKRGNVEQFLSVPRSAEACGPLIDLRDEMVYVNVQHPGDDGSFAEPTSLFPDYLDAGERGPVGSWRGPRPSTVQVYKKRGRR
ncbi:PhoX family protein [Myceligenerans salitolerans]|uniref:PhoX family phosphatase n=1 Tax=Myceligenerans salitolerans TaxID=1230528 RepID=A0ABS3I5Z1_9MICO|nr:PhoX family phosphatase [Myceligenerans salitolerans]MBO0608407.1 PhoX family phosphatase [Myceligenerans salitolerans]